VRQTRRTSRKENGVTELQVIEFDPPICRNFRIPLGHSALDLYGTTQGVHGTDEQDQQAVASCSYDPTTVFFDLGLNEFSMVSVQLGQRAFVIDAYQAAKSSCQARLESDSWHPGPSWKARKDVLCGMRLCRSVWC
jgi:hypothetical protein